MFMFMFMFIIFDDVLLRLSFHYPYNKRILDRLKPLYLFIVRLSCLQFTFSLRNSFSTFTYWVS